MTGSVILKEMYQICRRDRKPPQQTETTEQISNRSDIPTFQFKKSEEIRRL
jgi:hypothetical protein